MRIIDDQQSMNSGSIEWSTLQLLLHWATWNLLMTEVAVATLLPIIQAHVALGTEIWSDQWAAYNPVNSSPNISNHQAVNHSIEFKLVMKICLNHCVIRILLSNRCAYQQYRKLLVKVKG